MSLFPLFVALLSKCSLAMDIAESNTGAVLAFPSVIDGPLYNKSWEVAPAQFGYQAYGGAMEGVLILPANTSFHKECPPSATCTDCAQEPTGVNPYVHYINDWFVAENDITDYILIIDRLDCYFVDKIELAQSIGASGVIMCDWKYETLFTMWMPPDWIDDIGIPAVLLQRQNCVTLLSHIGVQNWDPKHIDSTIYPDPDAMNWTIATIEWGLPHDDDRVEWELWTSSNDILGSEFKHNFNTTAIMLDKANDTIFTPHMYILNGTHWGCPDSGLPCNKQCSNSGRYCAVDPEFDLSLGLDGIDVIQENLRALCVWEYDKEQSGIMDDIMWWDYAVLWDENCGVLMNHTLNFHVDCSYDQMDKLDASGGLKTYVQSCIDLSGGYEYKGGVNTILRRETKLKYNSSIYALPMVRVNEFLIHGNIDCPPPVLASNCEVLAAICAGFIEGTEPNVCDFTPAPTMVHCNDTETDCNGTCFGNHLYDACDECRLISDQYWNDCIGCNGQINETYDCGGTCGGHYAVNPCGYCKDTRHPGFATFGVDCNGTCSTELRVDECGECLTESDPNWNVCVGCDNTPDSNHAFNPCGRCIDSTRDDFDTFGVDCAGTCDGDNEFDECDVCLSLQSTDWNGCLGCDGIPYSSKSFNECGWCILSSTPNFNEYGKDCRGECPVSESDRWFWDECGKCLFINDATFNDCCSGDPGKKFNDCGMCIDRTLPDFDDYGRDCNGTCNGLRVVDACGECLLPSDERFDACVLCDNNVTVDCNGVCGGSFAVNPCGICIDSEQRDFETYGTDCAGSCLGTSATDDCGVCLNTLSTQWNSCLGCNGVPRSNFSVNPCGRCILNTRLDFETEGMDCASECSGQHEIDDCGNCLLTSDPNYSSCFGCDGVPYSSKTLNDCGSCVLSNDPLFDEYGRDCTGNCATTADMHYVDECGHCLFPTDPSWNDCMSSLQRGPDDNTFNIPTVVIIIAVSAFVLVCFALVVIIYLCKRHREMRKQFKEIQRIYRPMDDRQENIAAR